MSLREVATRAETSHALLRYHFGSLSGVLAAMLTVQRSRDNEALLKTAQQGTFDDLVVAIWRVYTRRSSCRVFAASFTSSDSPHTARGSFVSSSTRWMT